MPWQLRDWRSICLAAALLLVAIAIIVPRVKMVRPAFDVLAIVDITGSMNTRDMGVAGKPVSRLDASKASLRELLAQLPCHSRLGLGVFTERRSFVLFDPIEVCENFAPIDGAIAGLDWRMAWEGDSLVAKGLHHAIGETARLDADILFMTDGQEAPPLPPGTGTPPFEGEPGKVKGLVVGVGGAEKSPIPKYDEDGNEIGAYGPTDVPQENHSGPPPPDAEKRPGYHPKWAPFGNAATTGDEHLSSVRTAHLTELAGQTGLAYVGLKETPHLAPAIERTARPRHYSASVDIRPIPAALALAVLAGLFIAPLVARGLRKITSRTTVPKTVIPRTVGQHS